MNPLPNCSKLAINWENNNDLIIFRHDVIVNFFLTGFCFPCQVYMLVQVSCQYYYWFWSYDNFLLLEIDQKSGNRKYPESGFCPIFGDWNKLEIPNLEWMSLKKRYWMLQNARVTTFTISELLREKQLLLLLNVFQFVHNLMHLLKHIESIYYWWDWFLFIIFIDGIYCCFFDSFNQRNLYIYINFFFNWHPLHARLDSHYEAWSYKKKKHNKD